MVMLMEARFSGGDVVSVFVLHRKELFLEEPQRPLSGPVDFRYQYVNMADQTIVLNRTYTVRYLVTH